MPGGHSPAYFALLNNPPPLLPWLPRQDPAAFSNFPEFYLAHEIAHQWWGQAVGWKNYHEQWLSEGFAQYFAVLYAEHHLPSGVMNNIVRQMRRTAIRESVPLQMHVSDGEAARQLLDDLRDVLMDGIRQGW